MNGDWEQRLRKIAGRPENGRWLHVAVQDPVSGAVELADLQGPGGRWNPPRSFATAYLAEDKPLSGMRLGAWLHKISPIDQKLVILALDVAVSRVLDLGNAALRTRLGVSLDILGDPGDRRRSQALGAAAYHAGFAGIVYPRPGGDGARNMALFCGRTTAVEVSVVGARGVDS